MIIIKDLIKKFGDKTLFDKFCLQIEDGDFVVISGKSGCGKTTLLNIIGGIEDWDEGSIQVNDYNIEDKRAKLDYFRTEVGFLFQNFALVDNKTVAQNLNMVKKKYRNPLSIEEALEQVGLSEKKDEMVYKLSGGEQQRVALARLLLKKCNIILADEPTGSLDTENTKIVISILKKMQEQGKTIIMVTHDEALHTSGNRFVPL